MARYCPARSAITVTQCRWTMRRRCAAAVAATSRGNDGDRDSRCAARLAWSRTCCRCNTCRRRMYTAMVRASCARRRSRHCCRCLCCTSIARAFDDVVPPRGAWFSLTSEINITTMSSRDACPSEDAVSARRTCRFQRILIVVETLPSPPRVLLLSFPLFLFCSLLFSVYSSIPFLPPTFLVSFLLHSVLVEGYKVGFRMDSRTDRIDCTRDRWDCWIRIGFNWE